MKRQNDSNKEFLGFQIKNETLIFGNLKWYFNPSVHSNAVFQKVLRSILSEIRVCAGQDCSFMWRFLRVHNCASLASVNKRFVFLKVHKEKSQINDLRGS